MPVEECGDMLIMGLGLVNSLLYGDGQETDIPVLKSNMDAKLFEEDRNAFALDIMTSPDDVHGLDDQTSLQPLGTKLAQTWLTSSYRIFKQWTEYLIEFSLEPHNQLCTDDFAGWLALQTNLALKGIIGIKAMSELARVMGNETEVAYYKVCLCLFQWRFVLTSLGRTSPTHTRPNGKSSACLATAPTRN